MDETTRKIRRECRIETLDDLASLVAAGIDLTHEALMELKAECEAATHEAETVLEDPFAFDQIDARHGVNESLHDARRAANSHPQP